MRSATEATELSVRVSREQFDAITGALTGTWQPDRRQVSPDIVMDTAAVAAAFA